VPSVAIRYIAIFSDSMVAYNNYLLSQTITVRLHGPFLPDSPKHSMFMHYSQNCAVNEAS